MGAIPSVGRVPRRVMVGDNKIYVTKNKTKFTYGMTHRVNTLYLIKRIA